MGLERVNELMHRLGDPQNAVKVIHIAGTNGKGSVGAMLASVLTAAGFRTGHFSSPALISPRELFRISTEEISGALFAETLTEVNFHAQQMTDAPTEYELLAAMAYTLFARQKCDIAVVECCMGGDTDCTNVIGKPLLSIITNVQLDHCEYLGNTLAEIAAHKAGIIKKGCPVLFDTLQSSPEAASVIRHYAETVHAHLYDVNEMQNPFKSVSISVNGIDVTYQDQSMHLPLRGVYQTDNMHMALCSLELLREQGISIPEEAVRDGLTKVQWHGRFELLHRDPVVIFDGAHNPDGVRMLRISLKELYGRGKVVFLTGVMADKAYAEYPGILRECAHSVFAVKPANPRALDAGTLADVFAKHSIPAEACESVAEGVQKAFACAEKEQLPLIAFGSLYMYREFCEALQKNL